MSGKRSKTTDVIDLLAYQQVRRAHGHRTSGNKLKGLHVGPIIHHRQVDSRLQGRRILAGKQSDTDRNVHSSGHEIDRFN